jgi:hypothetical protein
MKKLALAGVVAGLAIVGISVAYAMGVLSKKDNDYQSAKETSSASSESQRRIKAKGGGAGVAAMEQAAREKKYLFAFFWKDESSETANLKKVFEGAMRKVEDRANSIQVCITDSSESGIVETFDLKRAPMPLAIAIAPNGAIMGGFPQKFDEDNLLNAFGSPCTEQCMKTMQEGNLVLLCVQNKSTASNEEAMKGVKAFAEDERYASATQIVMLDPADSAEKPFLTDLKIDPETKEAVTAFMAPPGSVIAEFKGATDKEELIAALQKAGTGCGPGGCGPGGCGPQK